MEKIITGILVGVLMIFGLINVRSYAAEDYIAGGSVLTPEGEVFNAGNDAFVEVRLVEESSGKLYSTYIQSNGDYYFTGNIPEGYYDLYAYAGGYNNLYSDSEKVGVQIQKGQFIKRDLHLTYPVVKGKICEPYGNEYYPGEDSTVFVYLFTLEDTDTWLGKFEVFEDGSYRIPGYIPEGEYYIQAVADGSSNLFMHSDAELLSIKSEDTLEEDLRLTELSLRGFVYTPDKHGLMPEEDSNVIVYLTDEQDSSIQYTAHVYNGQYRFGTEVPEGKYILKAVYKGSGNMADSKPQTVNIIDGVSFDYDILLTGGEVSGCSICGYVMPDFTFTNQSVYNGIKVEVVGTEYAVSVNSAGYFEIADFSEAQGEYILRISKVGYITRDIKISNASGNIVLGTWSSPILFWAGDVPKNGLQDGVVNISDIMELAAVFNSSKGDSRYNECLDFNMDNAINIGDIMIMVKSFNKSAENYPSL